MVLVVTIGFDAIP